MQLRMREDSVLSYECYSEVAKLVATELEGLTVEDLFNEIKPKMQINQTEPCTSADTEGDEAPTGVVEHTEVDTEPDTSVPSDDMGLPTTGGWSREWAVPETPDTHGVLGEVAQHEEAGAQEREHMDQEVVFLEYELY